MKLKPWKISLLAVVLALMPSAQADDAAEIKLLREQLQQLEQRLKTLERKGDLVAETADAKKKETPVITASASGFTIRSADTNFSLRIRGVAQADGRFYLNRTPANDTFLLRRVRPALEGTVQGKYDFRLMADFASGVSSSAANNGFLLDAYVNARFHPGFQIQAGKFKEPVGLERLQSGENLFFLERGFPTQLLPSRDAGFMLHGEGLERRLQYALGVFNGTADGGNSDFDTGDSDKDVAARLFAHPFRNTDLHFLEGLGLGISGTWGDHAGALRGYSSPGQQSFFAFRTGAGTDAAPQVTADGEVWRVSPQGYYYCGPFGLLAEYALSSQHLRRTATTTGATGKVQNTAWQLAASYFLTGEQNSFKPVAPLESFSLTDGGWGAWEIAARVGETDVDDDAFPLFANPATAATKVLSWGLGLNWHLNRNVKISLNYENTDFHGGDGNPALSKEEQVFLSRAQVTF